mmetsp:Transcript_45809/g.76192  ORF Transcript_45809/g.76192 Transcript_45809/m.76192 type:complete len:361 (-) Transcript_45809:1813-2895(-)
MNNVSITVANLLLIDNIRARVDQNNLLDSTQIIRIGNLVKHSVRSVECFIQLQRTAIITIRFLVNALLRAQLIIQLVDTINRVGRSIQCIGRRINRRHQRHTHRIKSVHTHTIRIRIAFHRRHQLSDKFPFIIASLCALERAITHLTHQNHDISRLRSARRLNRRLGRVVSRISGRICGRITCGIRSRILGWIRGRIGSWVASRILGRVRSRVFGRISCWVSGWIACWIGSWILGRIRGGVSRWIGSRILSRCVTQLLLELIDNALEFCLIRANIVDSLRIILRQTLQIAVGNLASSQININDRDFNLRVAHGKHITHVNIARIVGAWRLAARHNHNLVHALGSDCIRLQLLNGKLDSVA